MKSKIFCNRTYLAALFIFGESALYIPFSNSKSGNFSALIFAFVISCGTYLFWYFAADWFFSLSNKTLVWAFGILITAGCLLCAATTTKGILNYFSKEVLIKNYKIEILLFFIILMLIVLNSGEKALSKFSVIAFWFCAVSVIVLFVISCPNFKMSYLSDSFSADILSLGKQTAFIFLRIFLSNAVFAVFSRIVFEEKSAKADIRGFLFGFLFICICYLNGVLTFSLKIASELEFAYSTGIGVVNIGNLFTRMNGFAYFICFFSCLIKTAVSIISVNLLLKKLNVKNHKTKSVALSLLAMLISYVM